MTETPLKLEQYDALLEAIRAVPSRVSADAWTAAYKDVFFRLNDLEVHEVADAFNAALQSAIGREKAA